MRRLAILACLLLVLGTVPVVRARSFTYPNFTSTAGINLNGNAVALGGAIRLTANASNQTGNFFHVNQFPVLGGFDTTFDFRITPPTVGTIAEGMCFIVHNAGSGSNTLGGSVWGLGYGPGANGAAIPNSLVVELDTYLDPFLSDTSANEVSIHTNGVAANNENEGFSIGRVTPAQNFSNAQVHTMRVEYVPGTLNVYLNNLVTPILSVPYDIQTGGQFLNGNPVGGLNLPNASAWVGFGATTGANLLIEQVEILNWTWTSFPGADPCFEGNVGQGAGGPHDVLLINNSAGGFFRTVETPTLRPITFDVLTPPGAGAPMPYAILARTGAVNGSGATTFPFGTLCFPVDTASVLVMDSFSGMSPALLNTPLTPFTLTVPSISIPATLTLQGVIAESLTPVTLSVTNAVILEVVTLPAPTISSVSPLSGAPGTTITISGTNFHPGLSLDIGGVAVTPDTVTDTQVTFTHPAAVPCDTTLTVTHTDGVTQVSTPFNPTPTLTNAIGSSGPAAGNSNYILVGTGFATGTTVTIGGNPATINNLTANAIVMSTPPGIVGVQNVIVTTPGGCQVTTTYTYL